MAYSKAVALSFALLFAVAGLLMISSVQVVSARQLADQKHVDVDVVQESKDVDMYGGFGATGGIGRYGGFGYPGYVGGPFRGGVGYPYPYGQPGYGYYRRGFGSGYGTYPGFRGGFAGGARPFFPQRGFGVPYRH